MQVCKNTCIKTQTERSSEVIPALYNAAGSSLILPLEYAAVCRARLPAATQHNPTAEWDSQHETRHLNSLSAVIPL